MPGRPAPNAQNRAFRWGFGSAVRVASKRSFARKPNGCWVSARSANYHWYVPARERIAQVLDDGSFEEWFAGLEPTDPLDFCDKKPYAERLKAEQARTGLREAAIVGTGMIRARRVAFGVTDSAFIMGSMGAVVGEKLTRLVERATLDNLPLIIISALGGGARMHEGILSLMQMAKVSAALARYDRAGGLFISVLTNPTMGGVAASFASLGDVTFAEPKALIGFAGPAHDSSHDSHRAAQGISDQRVFAGARLHRPHRPPARSEERDCSHDRLLRQIADRAPAGCTLPPVASRLRRPAGLLPARLAA